MSEGHPNSDTLMKFEDKKKGKHVSQYSRKPKATEMPSHGRIRQEIYDMRLNVYTEYIDPQTTQRRYSRHISRQQSRRFRNMQGIPLAVRGRPRPPRSTQGGPLAEVKPGKTSTPVEDPPHGDRAAT